MQNTVSKQKELKPSRIILAGYLIGGMTALTFDFMWSVVTFSFAMSFSPGPNNTIAFSTGLNYGFISTVPFVFGASIGVPLLIVAVAWGLGELLTIFPDFYIYLRYAGVAYILYLSWKIAAAPIIEKNSDTEPNVPARRPTFLNGIFFQWVNPKAWLLAATCIATYVGNELQTEKLLFLCSTLFVLCSISLTVWSFGGKISRHLIRSPRVLRAINILVGLLLASSVLALF